MPLFSETSFALKNFWLRDWSTMDVSTYTFLGFFCFSWKSSRFHHFWFFFWRSIEFLQQNIDQSETGITDKKLLLELYVKIFNHGGHRDLPLSCMEYGWQGLAKFEIFTNLLWRKLKDWDRYLTVCQKVLSMW